MAEAVIWFAIERLASFLFDEAVSIYGFRGQMDMMQVKLKSIQRFLKDADGRRASNRRIAHWVNEMRGVTYEIEDVIDLFLVRVESYYNQKGLKGKAKRFAHKHKEITERWKIHSRIEQINKKIEEINKSKDELGIRGIDEGRDLRRDTLLERRRRDACEDRQHDVVGLEDKISSLVEQLVKGEKRLCVISVVGQAGLGKTLLARNVYNRAKRNFLSSAWIHVANHNPKEVLRELCKAISDLPRHEIERLDEGEMRERIADELKGKKYLVVLDDVWTREAWDAIRAALPDGEMGSRVLMTTQGERVAKHADVHTSPYKLPLLNHADSYKLLCRNAFPRYPQSCTQELKILADDIVERCGGLPLALVAVGRILSQIKPTVHDWEDFVAGFHSEITQGNTQISNILALSLDYLRYDLKLCLLYCCAFPGGCEIRVSRLLRLWIAEGFVKKQGDKRPEAIAMHYLNELVDRSLVEPCKRNSIGKIKTCRLHDVLREKLAATAREQNFFQIYPVLISSYDLLNCHRLAIHCCLERNTCTLHRARSFISFQESQPSIWYDQIKNFELLRVLDLEGVNSVKILPKEIGDLVLLRYLGLRHTSIETLPRSTKKLYNLETLDLRTLGYVRLSQSKLSSNLKAKHVKKLTSLRHLYFGNRRKDIFNAMKVPDDFGVNGVLKELQTLSYVKAGGWVQKSLCTMTNLRKLGMQVTYGYGSISTLGAIAKLGHLHNLYLQGKLVDLPTDAFKNLSKLTLDSSGISEVQFSELQKLRLLKNLKFINNAFCGKIMKCPVDGFPRLEALNLENLEQLEEVVVDSGAFAQLKYMRIASCNNLDRIPEGLENVVSLQELRLIDMPNSLVETVQPDAGRDWHKIRHIDSITITTSTAEKEIDVNLLN